MLNKLLTRNELEELLPKLNHYVYGLMRPNKVATPFYIGKGSGNRVLVHEKEVLDGSVYSSKEKYIDYLQENNLPVLYCIFSNYGTDKEALVEELKLQRQYGLKRYKHGNLLNTVYGQPFGVTTAKTQKHFIQDSINKHNNVYSYEKVKYKSGHLKVEITCPEHGSFWQTPNNHLYGQGCPKCTGGVAKSGNYYQNVISKILKGYTNISLLTKIDNKFRSGTPIKTKCNICGSVEEKYLGNITKERSYFCTVCKDKTVQDHVKEICYKNPGIGMFLDFHNSVYNSDFKEIKVKCKSCKQHFYKSINRLKDGRKHTEWCTRRISGT